MANDAEWHKPEHSPLLLVLHFFDQHGAACSLCLALDGEAYATGIVKKWWAQGYAYIRPRETIGKLPKGYFIPLSRIAHIEYEYATNATIKV